MKPIHYQVVGEEDYAFDVSIDCQGGFNISDWSYTSNRQRSGQLTPEQQQNLLTAIDELGIPQRHPIPDDAADAFEAKLEVGTGEDALIYPFWEGALESDYRLSHLVRMLETL